VNHLWNMTVTHFAGGIATRLSVSRPAPGKTLASAPAPAITCRSEEIR
jgi:hypothetical protein